MPAHRLSILLALALPALAACDHAPPAVALSPPSPSRESRDEEAGVARMPHFAVTPVVLAATTRAAVRPATPSERRGSLSVRRAVVARDVIDREPEGASDGFTTDETAKLFVFLAVRNDSAVDAALTVSFARTDVGDARERGGVTLTVPAAARRFRTWAYTRQVHAPGAWVAIVRDADGAEVTRLPFTVAAPASVAQGE